MKASFLRGRLVRELPERKHMGDLKRAAEKKMKNLGECEPSPGFTERVLREMEKVHPFAPSTPRPPTPQVTVPPPTPWYLTVAIAVTTAVTILAVLKDTPARPTRLPGKQPAIPQKAVTAHGEVPFAFQVLSALLAKEEVTLSSRDLFDSIQKMSAGKDGVITKGMVQETLAPFGYRVTDWILHEGLYLPSGLERLGAKAASADAGIIEGHYASDPVFVQKAPAQKGK